MTNFPPETHLTAARIAYPEFTWVLHDNLESTHPHYRLIFVPVNAQEDTPRNVPVRIGDLVNTGDGLCANQLIAFLPDRDDYRALREALDKEYGVIIWWNRINQEWLSDCDRHDIPIRCLEDEDITNLMLRLVQALVEAGVVEK